MRGGKGGRDEGEEREEGMREGRGVRERRVKKVGEQRILATIRTHLSPPKL